MPCDERGVWSPPPRALTEKEIGVYARGAYFRSEGKTDFDSPQALAWMKEWEQHQNFRLVTLRQRRREQAMALMREIDGLEKGYVTGY